MPTTDESSFRVAFGVLTVSDTCFKDRSLDQTGPTAVRLLTKSGNFDVILQDCVSDDSVLLQSLLLKWIDSGLVNVILTLGGTGIGKRDVTSETLLALLPLGGRLWGLEHALYKVSLEHTPMAALSRLIAGIRDEVVLVALPGSPRAATECIPIILPIIQHAVTQLKGWDFLNGHQCSYSRPVSAHASGSTHMAKLSVANRPRQSTFRMISVSEAQNKIFEVAFSARASCTELDAVFHENAINRFLGCTLKCRNVIPSCDVSIMDGYATRFSDGAGIFSVTGNICAGDGISDVQLNGNLKERTCIRVNTGGSLPPGANCVIPVEETRLIDTRNVEDGDIVEENTIEVLSAPSKVGQFIRPAGSDLSAGYRFRRGLRLGPVELGLLAGAGLLSPWPADISEVVESQKGNPVIPADMGAFLSLGGYIPCIRQPRIGLFSTGNELTDGIRPTHLTDTSSNAYDTNRPMLMGLLRKHGYHNVIDMGIVPDTESQLITAFHRAFEHCDLLVTTGGVSMGERDLVIRVLSDCFGAVIHFGRVFMKPGKPTAFASVPRPTGHGLRRSTLVLCLPGNPVSVYATCHLFLLPLLRCLQSCDTVEMSSSWLPTVIRVRLLHSVTLSDRPDYRRARLVWSSLAATTKGHNGADNTLSIPSARCDHVGSQMSSRLASCLDSNLLLILPPADDEAGQRELDSGTVVESLYVGD